MLYLQVQVAARSNITQVSGNFIAGEKVKINGREDISRTVEGSTRLVLMMYSPLIKILVILIANKKRNDKLLLDLETLKLRYQSDGKVLPQVLMLTFQRFKPGDVVIFEAPNTRTMSIHQFLQKCCS